LLPFNLRSISIEDAKSGLYTIGGQQSNQLYLVDANGTIDFPVLGIESQRINAN
jgi:hypothetical protein